MTLATRYQLDPVRLNRILNQSLEMAAMDAQTAIVDHPTLPPGLRHDQLHDFTLVAGWLRALQVEGHLELEVTE